MTFDEALREVRNKGEATVYDAKRLALYEQVEQNRQDIDGLVVAIRGLLALNDILHSLIRTANEGRSEGPRVQAVS